MDVHAYAAEKAKSSLSEFNYIPKELGNKDVEVAITHCGICHSDIHLIDNDWGNSKYPLVPGHEIIGTVTAIGPLVNELKIGQRVGIGWTRSTCMNCEFCISGNEIFCPNQQATCVGHHGGFADKIHVDARFALPIPEGLTSENAAPLLCGGITVYSPLKHFGVTANMKVGVIGVGGLGHLAIQFAKAFGCEVTAFSSSPTKEAEAKGFGASKFVSSVDEKAMKKCANTLDFIISTVNVDLDWNQYINILRPDGKLCFVGVAPSALKIPIFSLLPGRKSICSSPTGPRHVIAEMLDFCVRHNIKAMTEPMPMSEVNEALDILRENKARYRMVLVN